MINLVELVIYQAMVCFSIVLSQLDSIYHRFSTKSLTNLALAMTLVHHPSHRLVHRIRPQAAACWLSWHQVIFFVHRSELILLQKVKFFQLQPLHCTLVLSRHVLFLLARSTP